MEKYQTVGSRFGALVIDSIVTVPIAFVVSAVTSIFSSNPKFAFISQSATSVVVVFYYILLHARYGQTVGKKVMKIKVLDITEKPITFAQAVIRSLPQLFPAFVGAGFVNTLTVQNHYQSFSEIAALVITGATWIWHIANIIVCLSSDKKRALHDFIAGTVVVKTDPDNISVLRF